ncbi:hypothetical protein EDM00_10925 [Ornithobacterium rhinotracheale]|uniref:hypothetical protein n=1 Tax=Ornithobacterium rhinotracheale TaxID=28251 RepID=UPI00129CBE62|nr:hypothetical protein [Ornithobacterium rhinotracheale]MRI64494.1 hypothetical protein [Ornithobacterium rhinotracheale]
MEANQNTKQKINAQAGSPFAENPQLDVVYKTADNKYFYTENNAKNYAQTLADKTVTKLVRLATEPITNEQETQSVEEETNKKQTKTKK